MGSDIKQTAGERAIYITQNYHTDDFWPFQHLAAPGNGSAGNGTDTTAARLFRARICSYVGVEVHKPIER